MVIEEYSDQRFMEDDLENLREAVQAMIEDIDDTLAELRRENGNAVPVNLTISAIHYQTLLSVKLSLWEAEDRIARSL